MAKTIVAGDVFGRLMLLEKIPGHRRTNTRTRWRCRCACGTARVAQQSSLVGGLTRSCGCFHRDRVRTHGLSKTSAFRVWIGLRQRCRTPRNPDYPSYGGRGIRLHPAWDRFDRFSADMGPRPSPSHTLERLDNDGDYAPGNVVWAARSVQANNRRTCRPVTINGVTKTVAQWAHTYGVSPFTVRGRIRRGLSIEAALGL